jgi:hypothetical protein
MGAATLRFETLQSAVIIGAAEIVKFWFLVSPVLFPAKLSRVRLQKTAMPFLKPR